MNSPTQNRATALEDPEAIAEHAIGLLDKRFRDVYKMRVRMGCELEFGMEFRPDAPALANESTRVDPLGVTEFGKALLPNNAFIKHIYQEDPARNTATRRKYEIVTRHDHDFSMAEIPGLLVHVRNEFGMRPHHGGEKNYSRIVKLTPELQRFYQQNVDHIDYAAMGPQGSHDMHMNFSLEYLNGKPVFDQPLPIDQAFACKSPMLRQLVQSTKDMFGKEQHLIYHTDGQKKYFLDWHYYTGKSLVHAKANWKEGGETAYIENCHTPADANPYYAVLLQMAAIEDGLAQQLGKQRPAASLSEILDRLEPGLGQRFSKVEAAQPELRVMTAPTRSISF